MSFNVLYSFGQQCFFTFMMCTLYKVNLASFLQRASVHGRVSGRSLVPGFICPWFGVHLFGGSFVRGSLVRGSLVRRFICPGVHLSVLLVYYDFPCWNRSCVNEKNTRPISVWGRHSQGSSLPGRCCDAEIYMGDGVLLEYCGEISPTFLPVFQFLLSCDLMWPLLRCSPIDFFWLSACE